MMLAFVDPRHCSKCLGRMRIASWVEPDECNDLCLAGHASFADQRGRWGHLHWYCSQCEWREATMTAEQSGLDRWQQ